MTSGDRTNTNTGQASDWLLASQQAMNIVTSALTEAPFSPAIEAIDQYRGRLDALEALLIAQRSEAGHSDRSTEGVIKKSGGVSKGEAKKRTSRAKAIKKNPKLAKKLTNGDLSTEQVDVIAEASDKTDGAAANDEELIDEIGGANPDVGRGIARKFVEDHTSSDERNSRYDRQRRRRKAYKARSTNGLSRLVIEGDDESIDSALRTIRRRGDAMYREDGGRDVPGAKHERTSQQRMFDAAIEMLTSDIEPLPADSDGSNSNNSSQPGRRRSERPTMVFTGKLSDITNDLELLATWEAELIGTGIVPTAVASYYRCISEFAGQLVNDKGEVLWQGRAVRRATPGQWVALVVRDGGCVRCRADVTRCQAHHIVPFSAPAKGETNIDEMLLVCDDCHHWIHDAEITVVWDPGTGTWQYRNARWEEKAAKTKSGKRSGGKRPERPPRSQSRRKQDAEDPQLL